MNWQNLKQNKCPQCNGDFVKHAHTKGDKIFCGCGFVISMDRYKEITSDMISRVIDRDYEEETV